MTDIIEALRHSVSVYLSRCEWKPTPAMLTLKAFAGGGEPPKMGAWDRDQLGSDLAEHISKAMGYMQIDIGRDRRVEDALYLVCVDLCTSGKVWNPDAASREELLAIIAAAR